MKYIKSGILAVAVMVALVGQLVVPQSAGALNTGSCTMSYSFGTIRTLLDQYGNVYQTGAVYRDNYNRIVPTGYSINGYLITGYSSQQYRYSTSSSWLTSSTKSCAFYY